MGSISGASVRSFLAQRSSRTLAIVIASALVLAAVLAIGWSSAARDANAWTARANSLQSRLSESETKLGNYRDSAAASDEAQSAALEKEREYDRKIAALASQKDQLEQQRHDLDAQQQVIVASQLTDGVHVVGTDTAAGVYSTKDTEDCYYAWKTGTGSDASIIDNNIVNGPATVTLKAGDTFETNSCGTWNKIG